MFVIKVVVSELLAFVQNQIHLVEDNIIIQTCILNYNKDEIRRARILMYETMGVTEEKTARMKFETPKNHLVDIIRVIKDTDPDIMPSFEAKELRRVLPAEDCDIDRFCTDVASLKETVDELHSVFKNFEHMMRRFMTKVKKIHLRLPNRAVSKLRAGSASSRCWSTCSEKYADPKQLKPTKAEKKQFDPVPAPIKKKTAQPISKEDNEKRQKELTKVLPEDEIVIPYYLSRVETHTKPVKIIKFIKGETGRVLKVKKLVARNRVNFSSFVVWVPLDLEDELTDDFWPEWYSFRPFNGKIRKSMLEPSNTRDE